MFDMDRVLWLMDEAIWWKTCVNVTLFWIDGTSWKGRWCTIYAMMAPVSDDVVSGNKQIRVLPLGAGPANRN
jgi:hypothetical protein